MDCSIYLQFYWDMCSEESVLSPSTEMIYLQWMWRELPFQQSSTPPHKYGPAKTWGTYLHTYRRNRKRNERNIGCISVLVLKNCVAFGNSSQFFFPSPSLYLLTFLNECNSLFSNSDFKKFTQQLFYYPTVVMVTTAHQVPSQTPCQKDGGNWTGFLRRSYNKTNAKDDQFNRFF